MKYKTYAPKYILNKKEEKNSLPKSGNHRNGIDSW